VPLEGKTALVTGGGRGIGRATSLRLADAGVNIIVNFVRNRSAAEATVEEACSRGVRAHAIRANVGDPEAVEQLFDEIIEVTGGVDIVVSNAASGVQRPVLDLTVKHWNHTLNVNARSLLLLAQRAAPYMAERGWGRIVSVSSLGASSVLENYAAVGSSKAALEALTRYLAVELAPAGIRVNCVSGAVVETDALLHFPNREEMLEAARRHTPTGQVLQPDDLAATIVFLCSDDAHQICGQTIVVDGGFSLPT
jgi:enoyl-[acyl-carrier protein] reductase III